MAPRPRPLLGMVLGLVLGVVVAGLLWQLGVIDPGRTVLFGLAALGAALVARLFTRDPARARGRYTTAVVIAALCGGFAIAGVPDLVRPGAVSEGCTLEASAGDQTVRPENTASLTPFDVPADGVVTWTASVASPLEVQSRTAGMLIGGFDIPLRTESVEGVSAEEITGEVAVADVTAWIADRTWFEPTGTYHAYGVVSGGAARCAVDGFIRLAPAGLFATNTLVALWILLGVALLLTAWGALAVRRSFSRARDEDPDAVFAAPAAGAAAVGAGGGAAAGGASGGAEPPADHIDPVPVWLPRQDPPPVQPTPVKAPPPEAAPSWASTDGAAVEEPAGDAPAGEGAHAAGAAGAGAAAASKARDDSSAAPVRRASAWGAPAAESDGADAAADGPGDEPDAPSMSAWMAADEPAEAETPLDEEEPGESEPELEADDPEMPLDEEEPGESTDAAPEDTAPEDAAPEDAAEPMPVDPAENAPESEVAPVDPAENAPDSTPDDQDGDERP